MKLRNPILLSAATRIAEPIIRCWTRTLRVRSDNRGHATDPWDPRVKERFIYALWHENFPIIFALKCVTPMSLLVSQSRDGEMLSRIARRFGVNLVRGSSSQGGAEALDELVALSKTDHFLIAPDGPRGPRRQVKRGLAYLASRTGQRIVPMGVGFQRAWRTKSWDQTAVPKPGSVVTVVGGPIIAVPPGAGKRALEEYRIRIEQSLEATTQAAAVWANGQPLPAIDDAEFIARAA